MAKETKKENPLLSKNIPRPPAVPESQTGTGKARTADPENGKKAELENGITVEGEKTITVERQNGITVERQKAKTVEEQTAIDTQGEEKATIELSLYLRPSQDDKLDELQRAYKKRTGKRIHRNDIMRKLIEKATVEDIL